MYVSEVIIGSCIQVREDNKQVFLLDKGLCD